MLNRPIIQMQMPRRGSSCTHEVVGVTVVNLLSNAVVVAKVDHLLLEVGATRHHNMNGDKTSHTVIEVEARRLGV